MAKKKTATKKNLDSDQPASELSFEQSLESLERIVRQLEEGGLQLDESLAQYEQGVKYLKTCYEALRRAERKIELVAGVDADGRPITEDFDDRDLTIEEKQQSRSRRRTRADRADSSGETVASGDDVDEPRGLF